MKKKKKTNLISNNSNYLKLQVEERMAKCYQ